MTLYSATRDAKVTLSIQCPSGLASNLIANQISNMSLKLSLESHKQKTLEYYVISKSEGSRSIQLEIDYSPVSLDNSVVRYED